MRILRTGAILLAGTLASASSAATFSVTNPGDSGVGTLRQAILDANAAPGRDAIVFVSATLLTVAALPTITGPVDIDGTLSGNSRVEILAFGSVFFFGSGSHSSTLRETTIRTVGSETAIQIEPGVSDVHVFRNHVRGRVFIWGDRTIVDDGNFFNGRVILVGGNANVVSDNRIVIGVSIQFGANHRVSGNALRDIDATQTAALILENNVLSVSVCPLCEGIQVRDPVGTVPGVIRGNTITGGRIGISVIGGPAIVQDNLIRDSATGIGVAGSPITLTRNSITGGSTAIDLGFDGPTPNDPPPDLDMGANNRQNFPTLISAHRSADALAVSGSLASAASTPYTIEFFSSPVTDPKARNFVGSLDVTTDVIGNATFETLLTESVPSAGEVITATATNRAAAATPGSAPNDTSELSAPVMVIGAARSEVPTVSSLGLLALVLSLVALAMLRQ